MSTLRVLVEHGFSRRWDQLAAVLEGDVSAAQLAARDSYGATALHYTTMGAKPELCQRLIDVGAPVSAKDNHSRTPLHSAAYRGRLEICRILVGGGADLHARDHAGDTPYHYGSEHPEVLHCFLDAGFDVHTTNSAGVAPVHLVGKARQAATDLLEQLLIAGADPRARTAKQWTPLLYAAHTRTLTTSLLDALLDAGARLDDRDDEGNTATHLLALDRRPTLLEQLFAHAYGVDRVSQLTAQSNAGDQPVHFAARGGCCACLQYLHRHGARLQVTNQAGETPLHIAARHGRTEVVTWLLNHGPAHGLDICTRTVLGKSALEVARPKTAPLVMAALRNRRTQADTNHATEACVAARQSLTTGQLELASEHLSRALARDPTHVVALALRGELEHRQGALEAAQSTLNLALALEPNNPDVLCALGFVESDRRRFSRARRHFSQALQQDPQHLLSLLRRGYVHLRLGDRKAALSDYRAYLQAGGGELFGDTQEVEKAIAELTSASE